MPYLSKIRINPQRASAIRLLRTPYQLHGAVQAAFPNQAVDERVLWRLETDTPRRPHLLVLSEHTRPDWTHLVEQAGWPGAEGDHFLVGDYTPLLDRLAAGQEYAFRLAANPVQNTKRPDKLTPEQEARLKETEPGTRTRGFRVGHRTASAQFAWFLARCERAGFTIPAVRTTTAPAPGLTLCEKSEPAPDAALIKRDSHRFRKKKNGPQITLTTATFQGRLRVEDPEALRAALLAGIGPSKAYGCGLLTLAPLPQEAPRG
ncbi:type I-E CRISPR-associated protein Cas6/Cse3/CasE [Streptomyces sp. NBC_01795]|uniref:type I-E CRISPR-associated protein Cas6/Cse3/CasE n=1 Tax=unclassified Streptomyces TaxID=2593676 RepID=UPI002DD80DC9|nr:MULTISPECIES: type I-E CRISPR-associated protein Cas6/Cse3/CasE [unclassified Streptomyces]WSA94709.1 type I-E CRISPR-associated protein Cas6/Cse3/CasE [Streptomyces sp. NBC_01795]WSB79129.1 type I-E CRISPR-associated protein Cas6/Cse3/CasE [Streptomyces sp. NBC_01775]WSS12669.1 type I-E CRISPR-associated protein Cas6/Cse3/CasE [Streptomyces sp. NBC_01186]